MGFLKPGEYARALSEIAIELELEDRIQEQLTELSKMLASHRLLRNILINPAIHFSDKKRIVEEIGQKGSLEPVVVNFILVLLEHAQIQRFEEVVKVYKDTMDEVKGVLRGRVVSSKELQQDVRRRIHKIAVGLTGKEVIIDYDVDETLIGGFKLQIGSTIYDGSLQSQLDAIRRLTA